MVPDPKWGHAPKPKVASSELPWEKRPTRHQPQPGLRPLCARSCVGGLRDTPASRGGGNQRKRKAPRKENPREPGIGFAGVSESKDLQFRLPAHPPDKPARQRNQQNQPPEMADVPGGQLDKPEGDRKKREQENANHQQGPNVQNGSPAGVHGRARGRSRMVGVRVPPVKSLTGRRIFAPPLPAPLMTRGVLPSHRSTI
jgi:hypothetical protein